MKLASLILTAAMLGGCAIAGAGAGILQGAIPTQTQGGQAGQGGQQGPATAGNKTSAGKPVDKVTVNAPDLRLDEKNTVKAQATVSYLDGSKDGDIQWSSKDSTIVSVNPTTGEITGLKAGTATIYARAAADPDNKFAIINVTVAQGVTEDLIAVVTPSKKTLAPGATVQLKASITNSNTDTSANGTWASSNKQVAAVNGTGLVTAVGEGEAEITFTSKLDPNVSDSAKITVAEEEDEE